MRKTILTIAIAIQSVFTFGQNADLISETFSKLQKEALVLDNTTPESEYFGKWVNASNGIIAYTHKTNAVGYMKVRNKAKEIVKLLGEDFNKPLVDNSFFTSYVDSETDYESVATSLWSESSYIQKIWVVQSTEGDTYRIAFSNNKNLVMLLIIKNP